MEIVSYSRENVVGRLPLMNSWCSYHLKGYPYLYVTPPEQIINPSDVIYVNDPNALVVIATVGSETVGCAAGIPLSSQHLAQYYFSPKIINQFQEKGFKIDKIWYVGYFLMALDYREDFKTIETIYKKHVAHAKTIGLNQLCYVEVLRPDNEERKPNSFQSPEPWGNLILGFRETNVKMKSSWLSIQQDGTIKLEENDLTFFIKEI